MFTGLVEAVGELIERKPTSGGFRLRIGTSLARRVVAGRQPRGERRLPDGHPGRAAAKCMPTSAPRPLRVTTLGSLAPGSAVNLERPLRADSRFGGHFVQGHVDAVGHVEEMRAGRRIPLADGQLSGAAGAVFRPQGSIAVDGISLTVAGLGVDRFDVQLVPFTMEHTNLQSRAGARSRQPRMRHGR